jgi:peptide/nickel transport system permease protein
VRRLLVRRLAEALLVVLVAATATFVLAHLAPGDPFSAATENPGVTPEVRAQLRAAWGLDRPLPEQYLRWSSAMLRGEMGDSFLYHRPVRDAIGDALPATLLLSGTGLLLAFGLGIGLGAWQAARRGRPLERLSRAVTLALSALPDFWLAIVAMLTLAYWLPLFPISGTIDVVNHDYWPLWRRVVDRLHHLVLPASVLALLAAAGIARFQRAALLDALGEEFTRTARAKGVSERAIVLRHALRNALSPTLALVGLSLPALAGGAVFVERVFGWPGMGHLALEAVSSRDYPLIMGCVLVGSALVALGSLLADVLAMLVDPRLRQGDAAR